MKLRPMFATAAFFAVASAVSVPTASGHDPDNLVPNYTYNLPCRNGVMGNTNICQTDNGSISVWFASSMSAAMESRVRDSLDNSYDPVASLSVNYVTTPVLHGASETDIVYTQRSDLPDDAVGIYWCDDAVDSGVYQCDQSYIAFIYDSYYYRRMTACHETGHALGLLHGPNAFPVTARDSTKLGCMRTPFDPAYYKLESNNVAQLNETY